MFKIKLTASCPECNELMGFYLGDFTGGENPEVDISCFEQVTFHCDKCDKDFYTGDFDLLSDEDLN